jgi:hypothetical protein
MEVFYNGLDKGTTPLIDVFSRKYKGEREKKKPR